MFIVMLLVAVETLFPKSSWTATCTAGEIVSPADVLLGCAGKAYWSAGAPSASKKATMSSTLELLRLMPPTAVAPGDSANWKLL